jgi:hypothetical protein
MAMISPLRPRNPTPPGELREFTPSDRVGAAFSVAATTDIISGVTGLDCRGQSPFNGADLELRYRDRPNASFGSDRWRTTASPCL